MAWQKVKDHTGTTDKNNPGSLAVSLSTSVPAGNIITAFVAFDNIGTTGPTISSIAKQSGETNDWVQLANVDSASTNNAAGARLAVWAIETTTTWAATTYSITFSSAITAKACHPVEWSGGSLDLRSTVGTGQASGAAISISTTGTTPQSSDLVLGVVAYENAAAWAADTDTTNGSWSSIVTTGTSGGGGASNMGVGYQYKIVTASGHQTFDTSGSNDGAAAIIALQAGSSNTPDAQEAVATGVAEGVTGKTSPTSTGATSTGVAQGAAIQTAKSVTPTGTSVGAAAQSPSTTVQAATTYDKIVLGDTPVSFWNDATGTDAVGLSNLTKFNSPTTGTAPDGVSCMVFDGINQYAEGTDQNAYSIPTTGRLTFEAWIHPDVLEFPDTESTGYVNWAGKTGSGATNDAEWLMRMYSKTTTDNPPRPHRISGYAFNPDGGLGTGGYFQDPFTLGEWIHVVFVVNKADAGGSYPDGYGKLYKNGVLRDQDNLDFGGTPINPGNGTAPFRIGSARASSSFFKGAIAKPAIYDYELSSTQVLEHFNAMRLSLGLAQDGVASISPAAQASISTGAANNATVSTSGGGDASAEEVTVTGNCESTTRLVSASARTA